jgi:hypothetical protein
MAGRVSAAIRAIFTLDTSSVSSSLDKVTAQTKGAMAAVKKEVTESNHSLAIMGETIGVGIPRHIRGFISELPGVSAAMSAAFSGFAILLIVKVIAEVTEKVQKFREVLKAAAEAPKKIAEGFSAINGELQNSTDRLALTNDTLRASIAKLEGKPVNNLAIALDEARIHADELGKVLRGDIQKIDELFKKNTATFLQKTFMGVPGDEDIRDQNDDYSQRKTELSEAHQLKLHSGNLDAKQIEAEQASFTEEMSKLVEGRVQWLSAQIGVTQTEKGNLVAIGGDGSRYDGRLNKLGGLRSEAIQTSDYVNVDAEHPALVKREKDDKTRKEAEAAAKAAAAAQKQAEAAANSYRREQDEAQQKLLEEEIDHDITGHKRSLEEQLAFIASHSKNIRDGNGQWLRDKRAGLEDATGKGMGSWERTSYAIQQPVPDVAASIFANLDKPKVSSSAEITKATEEMEKLNREAAKVQSEQNIKGINWAEKTGQLSQYAAAMSIAAEHAKEFKTQLNDLKFERDQLLNGTMAGDGLTKEQRGVALAKNQNEQDSLTGGNTLQSAQDKYAAQSQTASAGMKDFFNSVIADSANAAAAVKSAMTQAMNGVNSELAKAMTGQKTSWAKMFQGEGTSLVNSGLKQGEGMLAKAFHLGGKRDGSSIMSALYVQDISAIGGVSSSATATGGGIFASLLKMLPIHGFAAGGDPLGLSLVGEKGPELANFGGGSHVTSNSDLRSMLKGGGGVTYNNTIDARGTNAADTEARVQQAMQETHAQSVQSAIRAQRENAARRPRSR